MKSNIRLIGPTKTRPIRPARHQPNPNYLTKSDKVEQKSDKEFDGPTRVL